jgi:transposase
MEHRTVIRFLTLKELKAREMQTGLESVYRPEAVALSTVKKWRIRFQEGRTAFIDDPRPGRPVTQDLAEAIQSMFTERPFMWCTLFCRQLCIGKVRRLRVLQNDLGLIK